MLSTSEKHFLMVSNLVFSWTALATLLPSKGSETERFTIYKKKRFHGDASCWVICNVPNLGHFVYVESVLTDLNN